MVGRLVGWLVGWLVGYVAEGTLTTHNTHRHTHTHTHAHKCHTGQRACSSRRRRVSMIVCSRQLLCSPCVVGCVASHFVLSWTRVRVLNFAGVCCPCTNSTCLLALLTAVLGKRQAVGCGLRGGRGGAGCDSRADAQGHSRPKQHRRVLEGGTAGVGSVRVSEGVSVCVQLSP